MPQGLLTVRTLVIITVAVFCGAGGGLPVALEVTAAGGVGLGFTAGYAVGVMAAITVAGVLHQLIAPDRR